MFFGLKWQTWTLLPWITINSGKGRIYEVHHCDSVIGQVVCCAVHPHTDNLTSCLLLFYHFISPCRFFSKALPTGCWLFSLSCCLPPRMKRTKCWSRMPGCSWYVSSEHFSCDHCVIIVIWYIFGMCFARNVCVLWALPSLFFKRCSHLTAFEGREPGTIYGCNLKPFVKLIHLCESPGPHVTKCEIQAWHWG